MKIRINNGERRQPTIWAADHLTVQERERNYQAACDHFEADLDGKNFSGYARILATNDYKNYQNEFTNFLTNYNYEKSI